ncbi:DUF2142 domain-containing protein [Dactylosporangium sucinum]|uniref:DUF2142 domain-containing protein n=1 Tax=Dactylosporangium sucinum TaxID=1424081 RepID=UPI00167D8894|nr:DUF2142 domain-containing protein [Dactylosporangium sucinum]
MRSGLRSGPRAWLLSFLAFFLTFGAWCFAAPYDAPPDEVQHSIRAAGVASFDPGQIFARPAVVPDAFGNPGMGAYQRVPAGMDEHAVCFGNHQKQPANCSPGIQGGPIEEVSTSAGRYNPLYYFVVGPPLRWFPNWGGLVAARLISSAICAALLASAFVCLLRWSRFGLAAATMLTVTTPMLAHLAGGINPNSVEISAGIALFAAGIPLLLDPPDFRKRGHITLMGISAVLLLSLRSAGPAWLAFGLFALLVPLRWKWLKEWFSLTRTKWWIVGVVVAGLASVAWIIGMKTGELVVPPGGPDDIKVGEAIAMYADDWWLYVIGMIGVAGWFDTFLWTPFYLLWISVVCGLIALGAIFTDWATRWRYAVFFVGGVVLPGYLQVSQVNLVGFITLGRYMMPLLCGLPLLAAWMLERENRGQKELFDARRTRTLTRAYVVLLVPIHLVMLVFAMVRWQRGLSPNAGIGWFNPLAGQWHPPTGSVLPLLLMVAGLVWTGWLFLKVPHEEWAPGEVEPAAEPAKRPDPAGGPAHVPQQRADGDGSPILRQSGVNMEWPASPLPEADGAPSSR